MKSKIDRIDKIIIHILQKAGRTKRSELAEKTALSVPAVSERLKRLEEAGIIRGYHAVVEPLRLGFDLAAFIVVTVNSSDHYDSFLDRVEENDEILECHAITGEGTHMIKVRAKNTVALERLLATMQSWEGVTRTLTRLILSSPKESHHLPITLSDSKR